MLLTEICFYDGTRYISATKLWPYAVKCRADALHDSQSEFDHAVFMEDAALFASIGSIRISNMETKRQHIRKVIPEYPAFLPATSR